MKSLTKSTKDQKIIILNGANEEDIFKKWLDVIGMLEEDFLKFSETDGFEIRKKLLETDHNCKLRSNGMPVPLLRNGYSIFNGTKYR
mgnify:CR=1 FL=1